MSKKRVRKAVTGLFCGICLIGIIAICTGIFILSCAAFKTGQGNSLNLLGYTVFINDQNKSVATYGPGTAIIVKDTPHDTLKPGDLIVCRDLDTKNQFYPVIRKVFSYDSSQPLSVTVESIEDEEILTVNRDDIIGKCIGSSDMLGKLLCFLQDQEKRERIFWIILAALVVLFTICFLWYLLLKRRAKRRASRHLTLEAPPDLLKMVERVDVPLESVSLNPSSEKELISQTEPEDSEAKPK